MNEEENNAKARTLYAENGNSVKTTARRLRYNFNLTEAEVAQALYSRDGLDRTAAEVAQALKYGLKLDALEVAQMLYSRGGLKLYALEVAQALFAWNGLHLDAWKVAQMLKDGLGISNAEIAKWLKVSAYNLRLTFGDAANVLQNSLNLSVNDVVETLLQVGMEPHYIAKALYSKDGFNLTFEEVAKALRDAGISHYDIGRALHYSLHLSHLGVVRVLKDAIGLDDVVKVAAVLRGLYFRSDTPAAAKTLRDGLELSASEIARGLYSKEGFNQTAKGVAEALCDGLELSAEEVAKVLKDGLELSAARVAKVLKDGLELTDAEVAKVLKDAGIKPSSHKTATEIKAAKEQKNASKKGIK